MSNRIRYQFQSHQKVYSKLLENIRYLIHLGLIKSRRIDIQFRCVDILIETQHSSQSTFRIRWNRSLDSSRGWIRRGDRNGKERNKKNIIEGNGMFPPQQYSSSVSNGASSTTDMYTCRARSKTVKVLRSETASRADDIPLLGRPFQVGRRGSGRYGPRRASDILLLGVINGKLQFSSFSPSWRECLPRRGAMRRHDDRTSQRPEFVEKVSASIEWYSAIF